MNQLLLLDKDGTVTRTKSGQTFVQNWRDQELIPGVAASIHQHRMMGLTPVMITNQGGVAAGHKTLNDTLAEVQFACVLAGIDRAYLCPDWGDTMYELRKTGIDEWISTQHTEHTFGASSFRKPECGMLLAAIALTGQATYGALYVGDRSEDAAAARKAGIRFMPADVFHNMGLQERVSLPVGLAADVLRYLQHQHCAAQQTLLADGAKLDDPMAHRLKLDALETTINQLAHILGVGVE